MLPPRRAPRNQDGARSSRRNRRTCERSIFSNRFGQTFVKNRIGCPKRAKAEIGFEAGVGLEEGLRRLIAWRDGHKAEVEERRRKVMA